GTEAAEFEALSETTAPPAGAGPPRVAVPLTEVPPWTELEASVMETRPTVDGMMVTIVDCGAPVGPAAVMVAVACVAGFTVVTLNDAEMEPVGIVMLAGTGTAALSDVSVT